MDFTAPTTLYKATKTIMKASQGAPIPKGTPDMKKATAGMFFGPLAKCDLKGAITNVWKCSFKAVHNKIHPMKPYVMTSRELKLEKDKPMLAGGSA